MSQPTENRGIANLLIESLLLPCSEMYSKLGYRAELVDPEYYSARGKTRRVYLRKVLVDDEEEDELESTEFSSASIFFDPNERVEKKNVPETT